MNVNSKSVLKLWNIMETVNSLHTTCAQHSDDVTDHLCTEHDALCCFMCSQMQHDTCKNVVTIKSLATNEDFIDHLLLLKESINDAINHTTKISTLKCMNIKYLKGYRDVRLNELDQMFKDADILSSVKSEIQDNYIANCNTQIAKLEKEKYQILLKEIRLKYKKYLIEYVTEVKVFSHLTLFILARELKQDINGVTTLEPLQFIRQIYDVNVETMETTSTIKLVNQMSLDVVTWDCDDNVSVQSLENNQDGTTEKEVTQERSENNALSDGIPSVDSQFSNIFFLSSEDSCSYGLRNQTNCSLILHRQRLEARKMILWYKNHFFVEKRNRYGISIECVCVNENTGYVIMGEGIAQRLVIYFKTGQKEGEVRLGWKPRSICIVDKRTVAVTASKVVLIVDTIRCEKVMKFCMEDACFGISCVQGTKFVVNCQNNGLSITNLYGYTLDTFYDIKGMLHICETVDDVVVYIRNTDNVVHFLNLKTRNETTICCPGLYQAGGITTDSENNIFISCTKTNRVFRIDNIYQKSKEVKIHIPRLNGDMESVSAIAYDTKARELCVIANDRRSMWTLEENEIALS